MSQINYHNVEVRQQEVIVLENVSFNIQAGEFVYLIGKVGSGKSSLLKTMYGELDIHSGSAEVLGYDLTHIRRKHIPALRKRIGIVFQDFQLLTDRNVKDNLDFVLKATGCSDKHKRQQRIQEVLELVGMHTKGYKMPHELSGGEQQRIVIARAILNTPDLILADEPTGNLDPETGRQIVELLRKICDNGSTIIMTTHNLQLLEEFPGKVFRCENHRVVEQDAQAPQETKEETVEEQATEEPAESQATEEPAETQATEEPAETQAIEDVQEPQQAIESQELPDSTDILDSPEYLKSLESLIPHEPQENNQ